MCAIIVYNGGKMSKYKNVGTAIHPNPKRAKLKTPENLARYGNKSKSKGKSNLTKGAFGKSKVLRG